MKVTATQIDAILPQTQCGLCGYKGCMPYATALADNQADINLCPPGGVDGLFAIGKLLNVDAAPFVDDMQKKAKPPLRAVIREAECIGCTKCIQACPIDAILGAAKSMHTVITDECSGCELCVAPCPVDCIDMVATTDTLLDKQDQFRNRYLAREKRLEQTPDPIHSPKKSPGLSTLDAKQKYIQEALLRAQQKKIPK